MTYTRWSEEQAKKWAERQPWLVGCNYIPSRCINNIEIWQEFEFDDVMKTVSRELALAASIGMNTIRMVLPFYVWKFQREGFLSRMDQFLTEAARHGIALMPVFFDDCCGPKEWSGPPNFGKQREPVPGHHGGTVATPFDGNVTRIGYNLSDERENWPELERYVRDIVSRYANDERIVVWDIWNEPGNSNRGTTSMAFMERAFEVARSENPIQPLTAGPWEFGDDFTSPFEGVSKLSTIERRALELSDVISYHFYGTADRSAQLITELKTLNRPLLITEWLHRPFRNEVADLLPLFKREGVGCYNWGLVAGKTQTYEPWDSIRNIEGIDLGRWQHDLFHADLSPYDEAEIQLFKQHNLR